MNDVWIVGKGPSIANLKKEHFGQGLVITLNQAIVKVESLGLDNFILSQQKDGSSNHDRHNDCPSLDCDNCPFSMVRPIKSVLMLHKYESIQCFPDYRFRLIFDAEQFGLNIHAESVMVAIEIALSLGYYNFHFLCFDSVTNGSDYSLNQNNEIDLVSGLYQVQAERLRERILTLNHEFITP